VKRALKVAPQKYYQYTHTLFLLPCVNKRMKQWLNMQFTRNGTGPMVLKQQKIYKVI
jgi:hypothetical protein